jgi:tripeptidyl-peptidase-1
MNPNPPDVHSISYLNPEATVHPESQRLFNDEVCKLGLRGITVIVASGDDGAPGMIGCRGGKNGTKKSCEDMELSASFPANCPFVTTVGATMGPEISLETEEVACQPVDKGTFWEHLEITSGGGFADHNIFPRPAYQYRVVKKYLNSQRLDPNNGDTSGRAYPDVSFLGKHYEIFLNGKWTATSGTSASAPAFASLISLLNGLRMNRGLPKLGFLNPLLYNSIMKDAFNDITKGDNNCCLGDHNCCSLGWKTASGWDPVTGLGSPKIDRWLEILLNPFDSNQGHHSDYFYESK